eukprot:9223015-Pyramimonas_sp.AAC.1
MQKHDSGGQPSLWIRAKLFRPARLGEGRPRRPSSRPCAAACAACFRRSHGSSLVDGQRQMRW